MEKSSDPSFVGNKEIEPMKLIRSRRVMANHYRKVGLKLFH